MFREIQGKLRWKYFRVEKHEFSRYRFFFDYWKVPRVRGGLQCKNGLGASRCEMQLSLKRKTCWLIDVQITEFYPVLSETITLQLLVVGFHILVWICYIGSARKGAQWQSSGNAWDTGGTERCRLLRHASRYTTWAAQLKSNGCWFRGHERVTPSRKLTWQWKITIFNRRYIFKWLVFYGHVSFRVVYFIGWSALPNR